MSYKKVMTFLIFLGVILSSGYFLHEKASEELPGAVASNAAEDETTEALEESSSVQEERSQVRALELDLASMSSVEKRTRNASVKVFSPTGSYGSGAYFLFEGYHVIFTAAHVVNDGDIYMIFDQWGNQRIGQVVYRDDPKDFAVLVVPEFHSVKPIRFKIPKYDISNSIGSEFVFSGYPARHNLTTIRGRLAGFQGPYMLMHSAAWMGASGSCIFDESGNFVGALVAISLARFNGEPVLIEDFVWALPFSQISWDDVEQAIKSTN